MLNEIINKVIKHHPYFSYEEIQEICEDFLLEQWNKIKEETKIKRLNKFLEKEFELDKIIEIEKSSNKKFSLETIPKYLFSWKSEIISSLINIKNITKNIEKTELFNNTNFQINSKDKISLIWKNGAWKTTLLKMILWLEEVTDGNIELASWLKIWYLSQDLFWNSTKNTLKQEMLEIFPEINKKIHRLEEIKNDGNYWKETELLTKSLVEIDWFKKHKLQLEILKYFGFSDEQLDFNVLQLSGWEQTKVQIAKFLIQEVDILILDEPTNHLDIEWIIFLEKFCNNWEKAVLSISHDVRFINNISDQIAEISGKKIHIYPGNYDLYLEEKQARFDKEMKDYRDQQRELDTQKAYINRFRANSAKATSVQSRIKALNKIEVLTKPENETKVKSIKIQLEKRLPEIILKLLNLEIWYSSPIIKMPEYLEVLKTDKIWIMWPNWAWKSTLLKTILWELKALSWEVEINQYLKIGSYSQVLEDLDMKKSIINELNQDFNDQTRIRNILWWLLITWEKVDQKINTLSWWERAKVALTKMLLSKPHIIIMDEPTNHLDIHSKEMIKDMLKDFPWTTVVVSHDRDLLSATSNKIWLIKNWILEIHKDTDKDFINLFE